MTFAEQKQVRLNKLNHTMDDKGHVDDSEVIMNPKRLDRSDSRHPTVQEFLSTPPSRHIIFFQLGFDLAAGNAADPHQVQNLTQGVPYCYFLRGLYQRFPVLPSRNRNSETLGSSLVSESVSESILGLCRTRNRSRNRNLDTPSLGIGTGIEI